MHALSIILPPAMKTDQQQTVTFITIDADAAGQRIDNFLRTQLKGVPKSMIYRILRKGEVRVNKSRTKPEYKLQTNDVVRIPPIRVSETDTAVSPKLRIVADLEQHILFEDDRLIVFNKPSGLAVHGGSGLTFGLIEGLRALRPDAKFLELVHRLDRETSGCILVAKKRSALRHLHEQLRMGQMDKQYLALVRGQWPEHRRKVKAALQKNTLQSGERMVNADEEGKPSETLFAVKKRFSEATLVCASPVTGRTHQIRVHCQFAGHVIAGDPKYGDDVFNVTMGKLGLKRLFLHAHRLTFTHPESERPVTIEAPLSDELVRVLDKLHAV